jgi:SAM-dependent methyltransferase
MDDAAMGEEAARTPLPEVFDRHYRRFWQAELGAERLARERALALELGGLAPGRRVLDVACGWGRMSYALAAAGLDVTGVDISDQLLAEARAAESTTSVKFVRADMRDLAAFRGFDCVLLWFTSFGYFDDETNRRVLSEAFECLVPGGRLLIETRHWDRMRRRFEPVTVRAAGDDLLIEYHTYAAETGVQETRQILLVGGRRMERTAAVRRYGFPELKTLCRLAGFTAVRGYDENGRPLAADSDRCVVVATR